jgi:hypothetical protein
LQIVGVYKADYKKRGFYEEQSIYGKDINLPSVEEQQAISPPTKPAQG